jgi:hypothetical protein
MLTAISPWSGNVAPVKSSLSGLRGMAHSSIRALLVVRLSTVRSLFARAFRALWRAESIAHFPGISVEPSASEPAARFIFSKSHFSRTSRRVKPRALEPPEDDLELSVFRTHGLSSERIWDLGTRFATGLSHRSIHARADFPFAEAFACALSARRDEPPPRHAVLHGWPTGKDARMSVAQQLAARVILELPPDVPIRG